MAADPVVRAVDTAAVVWPAVAAVGVSVGLLGSRMMRSGWLWVGALWLAPWLYHAVFTCDRSRLGVLTAPPLRADRPPAGVAPGVVPSEGGSHPLGIAKAGKSTGLPGRYSQSPGRKAGWPGGHWTVERFVSQCVRRLVRP